MRKKLKEIFYILGLFLISIFLIPQAQAQYEDGTGITPNYDQQGARFYIHLPDFKFTNPEPVSWEKFGSDNITKYASNDDPHIQVNGIIENDVKISVYKLINGIGIFDRAEIVKIFESNPSNTILLKYFGQRNELKTKTEKYIAIHLNYDEHTDIDTLLPSKDASTFLAGAATQEENSSKFLAATYTAYKKFLTFNTNKIAYLSEAQESNLIKESKSASGACFSIKPEKTNNSCTNTIASGCSLGSSNKTFFLYGISCENLNSLFADKDTKASIVTAAATTATASAVKLKDEIKVQIQVPFGKVQNGITFPNYINAIYEYLMGFALVLAGIMLSLGGFQYIMGRKSAKATIKNAILGLVLLATSYTILQVVNPNVLELKELKVAEIKSDPFNGQVDSSNPPGARTAIHANCSSIPGPTAALPSGVTPPAGAKYDFNRYKNIKGFNPMCVLSDKALTFDSSYDATKIQTLLEQRNSILAKIKITTGGITRTVAEVIYNAAKANNISPQILLVKLQKEQSLLSNKALQALLNVSTLSAVTDTMIQNLDTRLKAANQSGAERTKTNMLNFAMGFEWRTGESKFMTRTASEIDELVKGGKLSAIEKQILTWATGVLEYYKVEGWQKMSPGERYIRGRINSYDQKLKKDFGAVEYSPTLTSIQLFGGLDRQIYMAAYGLGRCGSTKIIAPLDYVGAMKNTESKELHAISAICPGNRMTACLYSYTPHVSAQSSVIKIWRYLGFDTSYIFPESECGSVPSEWLQIGK